MNGATFKKPLSPLSLIIQECWPLLNNWGIIHFDNFGYTHLDHAKSAIHRCLLLPFSFHSFDLRTLHALQLPEDTRFATAIVTVGHCVAKCICMAEAFKESASLRPTSFGDKHAVRLPVAARVTCTRQAPILARLCALMLSKRTAPSKPGSSSELFESFELYVAT